MKVELERSYPMPGSADAAWTLLQDIEGVAACMPGARITERIDAQRYKGTVSVRFGPASMSFRGEVEVSGIDPAGRALRLAGKGTDTTGGSAASMELQARVVPVDASSCTLVGTSEMTMSGKAATFGGRMAGSVADQVLKQFAANFAAKLQALPPAPPAAVDTTPIASSPIATSPNAAAPAPAPAVAPSQGPAPAPMNGLALAWAIIRDWLRSLFASKPT
ncbi:MAG TPA: SRPBCC family protein [Burkholderiaceae bacterium]|nr:SRPBCC family protein [Burkholderiaceae bacterium]